MLFDAIDNPFSNGNRITTGGPVDLRRLTSANGIHKIALLFLNRVNRLRITGGADEKLVEDMLFPIPTLFRRKLVGAKLSA